MDYCENVFMALAANVVPIISHKVAVIAYMVAVTLETISLTDRVMDVFARKVLFTMTFETELGEIALKHFGVGATVGVMA